MNKGDLIEKVAGQTNVSKADTGRVIDTVFDEIAKTLAGGGDVRLVGFGTFSVSRRKATTGRNPRTGESIQIPASKQAKFKAGKELKSKVNR